MQGIRTAIAAGSFQQFRERTRDDWARGDIAPR
jgi:queuine tRNA-ribosyltransferase